MHVLRAVGAALAIWGGIDILIRLIWHPVTTLLTLLLVAGVCACCIYQSVLWRHLSR